jgi:hypothetical protein
VNAGAFKGFLMIGMLQIRKNRFRMLCTWQFVHSESVFFFPLVQNRGPAASLVRGNLPSFSFFFLVYITWCLIRTLTHAVLLKSLHNIYDYSFPKHPHSYVFSSIG